jgi:hypothetical protein
MVDRRQVGFGWVAAGCAGVLLVHVWMGFFSRYIADDFEFANAARGLGLVGAFTQWYSSWSGRFSATLLLTLLGRCGPAVAPFVPVSIVLLWICAASLAVRRLWPDAQPVAGLALAISFVYGCLELPDLFQSLFWQSGAITYALPLVILTFALARILTERTGRWRIYGEPAVLSFFAAGFSEIAALSMVAFSVIAAIFASGRLRRCACFSLSGAILALLIIAAAPGNGARRAHFSPPPLAEQISLTVKSTIAFLTDIPARSGLGIIVIALTAILAGTGSRDVRMLRRAALATLVTAVASAAVAHFAPIHVGYGVPSARALITPHFFILCAVVAVGLLIGASQRSARLEAVLWSALVVAVAAGPLLAAKRNAELVPSSRAFAARWDNIEHKMLTSKGKDVRVRAPADVGGLFFISDDPSFWTNRSMARYYGVRSLASSSDVD